MGQPNRKELEKEKERLKRLGYICSKILQAYRIRLACLGKRHEVLKEIEHKFENIELFKRTVTSGRNPNQITLKKGEAFYSVLDTNLKRERKILDIVRRSDAEGEEIIAQAIRELRQYLNRYNANIDDPKQEIALGGSRKLSLWSIKIFLEHMIQFLELMRKDVEKIEGRMAKEELFLIRENRNPEYFDDFILAWYEEMKANEKLIEHYETVLRLNRGIIYEGELRGGSRILVAGSVGSLTYALLSALERDISDTFIFGAVGATLLLINLIWSMGGIKDKELIDVQKDKNLIKRLKKIKAIKPWWRRMFSTPES